MKARMTKPAVNSRFTGYAAAFVAIIVAGSLVPGLAAAAEEVEQLRRQMEDIQERIEQLERSPGRPAADREPTMETPGYQKGEVKDEGFVSKDQSGNDPRDFTSKFMPYYRYTELENDVEVNELYMFGFFAFNTRFGMTYEIPVAREIDYSDVSAFKTATAGGCPPSPGSGSLPPVGPLPGGGGGLPFSKLECDGNSVGLGDTILRFFLRPQSWEFSFGPKKDKGISWMPLLEFTVPTATEDVLGGDALIASPGFAVAFDAPFNKPPFSLGFLALMNFYDFDAWKENDVGDTSRYRGRWFWMQPLSKPTPEFALFDTSGFYVMPELQPVYDFEEDHFSFWIAPELGKIAAPGHVFFIKPGFGIDGDADKGDREFTIEVGYRYFFN